ncbi:hypothetical protein MTX78_04880 [Hymenobacter tibetensis]|uniref:Glycosyltransferase RgtA/B/C/D-like domain-containing protein n=1 Tax=Hymenobacter tibetensis TaxID=497967 RepID=A0ABY4D074_9BACT|nr:hypothetical protein [Hymenobacter tibetensis]UOG75934.1 hypothetical protein MTX78_04880 [Hymenobacter tibetensis]
MIIITAQLFSLAIISIIVCFVVGSIIVKYCNILFDEIFYSLFFPLIIGVSVLIGVYAVITARGSTMQLPVLLLIGLLLRSLRRNAYTISSDRANTIGVFESGATKLLLLVLITSLVLLVQYLLLYDSDSQYLQTPFQDYVYYSRLTLPLNHRGLETNSLEALFPQFLTEQPYHYSEIWLNALFVKSTDLPSVWVYFISVASVFISIICVGFMALMAHFKLKTLWVPVLAFLFLFVTGVRWGFLQHNLFVYNGALLSSSLLCLNPKFVPAYAYIILGALFLLKKQYIASGAALAVLPLVFISTTPVIGVGIAFLALYLVLAQHAKWAQALLVVLPVVGSIIYIVVFYSLQPEPYQFPSTGRVFALQSIIPSIGEIKTLFNIAVGAIINYVIYFIVYFLLILLIFLLRRQSELLFTIPRKIILWFGVSLCMAAAMRAFGTHFLDSFQFFSNTMVPLTSVVLAIVLAAVLHGAKNWVYGVAVSLLAILATFNFTTTGTGNTRYSPNFLKQVAQAAPQLGARGGYVLADEDYENAYMLSPDSYTTGNYISNFKNDYAFVSLSELDPDSLTTDPRFKRDSAQAEQIVRKSSLYRFAKFQALKKRKLSLDSIKYEFVTQHNIGFVCVSKRGKLPEILSPLVAISYTDSLSGERLYVLRTRKTKQASTAYKDLE